MKPSRTGRADVHAGALADRLQTLEHSDRLGVIRMPSRARLSLLRHSVPFAHVATNPEVRAGNETAAPSASGHHSGVHKDTRVGSRNRAGCVTKLLQNTHKIMRLLCPRRGSGPAGR